MQIKHFFICGNETEHGGALKILFQTYSEQWFVTSHVVGQVIQLTADEAAHLISQTKIDVLR